jgi:hypothetical protein
MVRALPVLSFAVALAACGGGGRDAVADTHSVGTIETVGATYAVSLRGGQPVALAEEDLTLQLIEVKDSRCPSQVQCIWAGYATVTLAIAQSGSEPVSLILGTPGLHKPQPPNYASHGAYRFTLRSLEPSPVTSGAMPVELYRAEILVEKR